MSQTVRKPYRAPQTKRLKGKRSPFAVTFRGSTPAPRAMGGTPLTNKPQGN